MKPNFKFWAGNVARADQTRQRNLRNGFVGNGSKLWSADEIACVKLLYPDVAAIRRRLPHRTRVAIMYRASLLKLTRPRRNWTGADLARLRRLYPVASREELRAAFPGRAIKHIQCAASRYKCRRRRPHKPCGERLMNEILKRADGLRLSLRDLDEIAGTKSFFKRANWRRPPGKMNVNGAAYLKAIAALGGRLVIEWED